jgi:hypothetical protein
LKYFIIGYLLGTIGEVLIHGLADVIEELIELAKAYIGLPLVQHNVKIRKINSELEENQVHAIGFETNFEGEEEEDDEEY